MATDQYIQNCLKTKFKDTTIITIAHRLDTIADYDQRFKLACEQIKYLINQPQEDILAKIRHITEYNKQVMLETDWYGDFSKELRAVLLAHTN